MREVGIAVIVAPIGGGGKHVFRNEAARLQAIHDIPDAHVILFDHNLTPAQRYAFVCAEFRRITRSLPAGQKIRTVFVIRHGYAKGGQEGIWTHNVDEMIEAGDGRLDEHINWILLSCSNAATIGKHPDGDMSLADVMRDRLCAHGYRWCQTYGHLIAGHATRLIADRAGGTWRPLARWFRGEGRPDGGIGGEEVLPRGHELLDDLFHLMRKSIDPDDDGPEEMIGFRFLVPLMESRSELITWVQRYADVRAEAGHHEPTTLALQHALKGLGFDPGPEDGEPGKRTTAAVRAFQRAHSLKPDGIPGPLTWAALRAAGAAL